MEITKTKRNPVLLSIGEKVRKVRKSNPDNVNYEVFAFHNKINKVTLQRIEKGENYTMDSLLRVLNALNIKLSDFFSDID